MGIACAPQIWMDYITLILNDLDQKSKFIAIMDDLLIHSTKQEHWGLVESLMKAMIKNGLKLSPKKCQFFKTNLTYMGNQFIIRNKTMTITPLKGWTEAIQQIPTPRNPKECKSFCGMVNYVSLFCKDLQHLLRPIVELTRKGRPSSGDQSKRNPFGRLRSSYRGPRSSTFPGRMAGSSSILIPVGKGLVAHCGRSRRVSPACLALRVKPYQKPASDIASLN